MPEVEIRQTRLQFKGTGFQALGWVLLSFVLGILVVPAGWGAAALYRWGVRSLSFNDDTKASFVGRGREVWWQFALLAVVGYLPHLSRFLDDELERTLVSIGLSFCLLPLSTELWLRVIRWVAAKLRLSFGPGLQFEGEYFPFLGWMVLFTLSSMVLIPIPWVMVAILRWICRNIKFGGNTILFTGSGGALFWRGLVAALPTAAIALVVGIAVGASGGDSPGTAFLVILYAIAFLPLPWMLVWVTRWLMRCVVINRPGEAEPDNIEKTVADSDSTV